MTYLAISQDKDGNFKFVVAEGVNEEGPILSFGDTNMRTRFTCGAREFVNRWSEAGPTHHMAAATGRHIDTILKVAKIFNVPVEIVTRYILSYVFNLKHIQKRRLRGAVSFFSGKNKIKKICRKCSRQIRQADSADFGFAVIFYA